MIKKSESCSYCTPDGAQCTRAVDAEGTFCRWHSGLSSLSLPELEQMVAEDMGDNERPGLKAAAWSA